MAVTDKNTSQAFISIHQLDYSYTGNGELARKALDNITVEIFPGEFAAIIGTNGSGKSTLARHLNALLLPSAGRVLVNGLDTREPGNAWVIRSQVGMVFQNPDNQTVAATIEEDVAFGPENLGLPPAQIRERVLEVLAQVGLDAMAERPPHTLSGGQKQLLAIAGVLAMRPRCIILDEPTAMLDPEGRRKVLNLLHKLNQEQGVTIILITHFMEEVGLCDQVLVMHKGQLVLKGNVEKIFAQPEYIKEIGLEMPPAQELASLLCRRGLCLPEYKNIFTLNKLVDRLTHVL